MISIFTFSTLDATRRDTTTGLVDWMLVKKAAGVLLSLFGFNNGAQQWVQLFDVTSAGLFTGDITDTDNSPGVGYCVGDAPGFVNGQAISLTGIAGLTTGYARMASTDAFQVYDTREHAIAGGATGLLLMDNLGDTGSWALLPLHTFAIGAADNFSVVVPVTGIGFSNGLAVAVSTTGALYTAGAKDVTFCGTLRA